MWYSGAKNWEWILFIIVILGIGWGIIEGLIWLFSNVHITFNK